METKQPRVDFKVGDMVIYTGGHPQITTANLMGKVYRVTYLSPPDGDTRKEMSVGIVGDDMNTSVFAANLSHHKPHQIRKYCKHLNQTYGSSTENGNGD